MSKHQILSSLRNYPHYTLARAIERERGGTTLYTDDGARYWPVDPGDRRPFAPILGVNFAIMGIA